MNTVYTQVEGEDWETKKRKVVFFTRPPPHTHTEGDEKLCNCVRTGQEKTGFGSGCEKTDKPWEVLSCDVRQGHKKQRKYMTENIVFRIRLGTA